MNLTIAASVAAAVTLVSASPAFALSVSQTDVVVDSLANVYGTAAGGGAGVAPYQFALPGWTERVLTMDFVRGEVSCAFGVGPAGPDGGTCANNQTAINPAGNTSGIAAPRTMFLVG
ncbi:MAG: hypothetical protein MUF30_13750, partial [Burkholderiales bacterium]|nr:hypothetical protein [Burkholderiales bacterium]